MNYKIIMLPQPILVSDEEIKEGDWFYHPKGIVFHATPTYMKGPVSSGIMKKIIAGLPDLPKLDLSLIGWVDVENKVKELMGLPNYLPTESMSPSMQSSFEFGVECFKAAQNEKKYSEEDMKTCWQQAQESVLGTDDFPMGGNTFKYPSFEEHLQSLSKPKEYLVEVEMGTLYFDGTRWVDSLPKKFIDKLVKTKVSPKITNNTIKILRTI